MADGLEVLLCQAGRYSRVDIPSCWPVCPDPPPVDNATITVTGPPHALSATYECYAGFVPSDGVSIQTQCSNGRYEDINSSCLRLCPNAPTVPLSHHTVIGDQTAYRATYTCDSGYTLVSGDSVLNCSDGILVGVIPSCAIVCPDPPIAENSRMEVVGRADRWVVRYTCTEGYTISSGQSTISCVRGIYIGCSPVCSPVCPDPPVVTNADIIVTGEIHSRQVIYQCWDDFVLHSGDGILSCYNGTYDSNVPACIPTCPSFIGDAHMDCVEDGNPISRDYQCKCHEGMIRKPSSSEVFACLNGTLTDIPLDCEPPCYFDYDEFKMKCVLTEYLKFSLVYVDCQCNDGYVYVSGNRSRRCLDGLLYDTEMTCSEICPQTLVIENGFCTSDGASPITMYTCRCLEGYSMVAGDSLLHCTDPEMYDKLPKCVSSNLRTPEPNVTQTLTTNRWETRAGTTSEQVSSSQMSSMGSTTTSMEDMGFGYSTSTTHETTWAAVTASVTQTSSFTRGSSEESTTEQTTAGHTSTIPAGLSISAVSTSRISFPTVRTSAAIVTSEVPTSLRHTQDMLIGSTYSTNQVSSAIDLSLTSGIISSSTTGDGVDALTGTDRSKSTTGSALPLPAGSTPFSTETANPSHSITETSGSIPTYRDYGSTPSVYSTDSTVVSLSPSDMTSSLLASSSSDSISHFGSSQTVLSSANSVTTTTGSIPSYSTVETSIGVMSSSMTTSMGSDGSNGMRTYEVKKVASSSSNPETVTKSPNVSTLSTELSPTYGVGNTEAVATNPTNEMRDTYSGSTRPTSTGKASAIITTLVMKSSTD